jgi:hypothetical protein
VQTNHEGYPSTNLFVLEIQWFPSGPYDLLSHDRIDEVLISFLGKIAQSLPNIKRSDDCWVLLLLATFS